MWRFCNMINMKHVQEVVITTNIKLLGWAAILSNHVYSPTSRAYPTAEYPETSLSGRDWMGTDFLFHYINTRISRNLCFRIRKAMLGTNPPIYVQKCLQNPKLSDCVLDVCIFVIDLSKILLSKACMTYHLKGFVICHKSYSEGVKISVIGE